MPSTLIKLSAVTSTHTISPNSPVKDPILSSIGLNPSIVGLADMSSVRPNIRQIAIKVD